MRNESKKYKVTISKDRLPEICEVDSLRDQEIAGSDILIVSSNKRFIECIYLDAEKGFHERTASY